MTTNVITEKKKLYVCLIEKYAFALVALSAAALVIIFPDIIRTSVLEGISLCVKSIVPTLFPFIILSDFLLSLYPVSKHSLSSALFEKAFGIGAVCVSAFVCGAICGFPIGAILIKSLYDNGAIDKKDAENMLPIATLPSFVFVISGVGSGLFGNVKLGMFLWFASFISTIAVGFIFRSGDKKLPIIREIPKAKFNLASSIKKSGFTAINISSFIIFFSAVLGVLKSVIKNEYICAVLAAFFEIGNACNYIAYSGITYSVKLPLLCFALGFSGLSVFMQVVGVVSDSKISCKTYFVQKTLQGVLCALIALLAVFSY